MRDLYKFTPHRDILVPMAEEMLDLYRQNSNQDMIDMIVRLARAWDRHDVWLCVFESEKAVCEAILTDKIYNEASRAAQNYIRARDISAEAAWAIMDTVRMHPYAWKYPEIYAEVFQNYGVDHFDNYRDFDSPMEAAYNMFEVQIPIILNRVWNEGEDGMFFTGVYADEGKLGASPLEMFLPEHITLPESYRAYLDLIKSK